MADTENTQPTNELSMEELEKATAPASAETPPADTAVDAIAPAPDAATEATPPADAATEAPTAAPTEAPTEAPPAPPAVPTPAPAPAPVVKAAAPAPKQPLASAVKPVAQAIKPVVTKTAAPVVEEVEAPVDAKAVIAAAQAEASTTGKILLQNILDYMDVMAPRKPVSVEVGARHQVALYRAITRMINGLEDDFSLVFTAFLRVFAAHGAGVFSETHVFRFMESISLPQDDIKGFQRLLNLFINTADPKGRAMGLKMTDFNKTLEFGISDEGRARVLTYFNK